MRLATAENLATVLILPERANVSLQRLMTLGYGLFGARDYISSQNLAVHAGAYDAGDF
jgi:hypothetical protein